VSAEYYLCIKKTSVDNDKCENFGKQSLCFPKCFCDHAECYDFMESSMKLTCTKWVFSCGAPAQGTTGSPAPSLPSPVSDSNELKMSDYDCDTAVDAEYDLCSKKALVTITGDDMCEAFGKLSHCFPKCFCDNALAYQSMTGYLKCTKLQPCGTRAQGSPAPSLRASTFTVCIACVVSLAGAVNLISV
jgi:hypothetical protein